MDKLDFIFYEDLIRGKLFSFESPDRIKISDDYFTPSAVLFSIIPYETKPFKLVLIHRTEEGLNHRGEMSFPGGKKDLEDRTLLDTALRECEEEIGVPRSAINILGALHDFPTMTKYIITPIIGYFDKNNPLVKDDREVQEILKIPIDFFINKKNFREQAFEIDNKKFPVFYFNYKKKGKKYTIWGATAYMIASFIDIIFGISLSNLRVQRFTAEEIKPLKDYINLRNKILRNQT